MALIEVLIDVVALARGGSGRAWRRVGTRRMHGGALWVAGITQPHAKSRSVSARNPFPIVMHWQRTFIKMMAHAQFTCAP